MGRSCETILMMFRQILLYSALAAGLAEAQDYENAEYKNKIQARLAEVDRTVGRGPFQAEWKSLEAYKVPKWYLDAKFGIFIHWGVYSVPAFDSEWYPRNMYVLDSEAYKHHVATYGPQSKFGYKDFIPSFTAARFDAGRWAALFRQAGAKYVVPVAEHHDGFPMYDCSFTDWSAAKMGPKRDIVGELAAAVRKEGLHFGASSHRAEHWWFYNGGRQFASDVQDPTYANFYGPAQPDKTQPDEAYLNDWLARTSEIVDKYKPELIWFDWWIEQPVFQPYLRKFAAFYYNRGAQWGAGAVINYKNKSFPERAAVLDIERGKLDATRTLYWQTDTSVSEKSWGFIKNDRFRTAASLVGDLVDIVSKNGTLLLNVGPRPDGTIPEEAEAILRQIGRWLEVNGEAIYGTRPYSIFGEGPTRVVGGSFKDTASQPFTADDIRFTTKNGALYAIFLAWPANGKVTIRSLGTASPRGGRPVHRVTLLGSAATLKWTREASGLAVELPAQKPCDFAYALKME